MTKFNTHGGYFAPTGYFRVDTGGSHEENPNGGVQIGVDPEGTPNMLEEGEPVYNDYVYSDNITADKEILKKHNIPASYAGKLYSVIADAFVDEAEERPLDNISNNGLNAMLVRLADAQEEQKQIQEQKELEDELANLSPEELEELEQMLAQQEALEAQQAQLSPEEQMAMEQQMQVAPQEQAPMMQMPMMAYGGNVKRGSRNNTQFDIVDTSEKEGDREKFAKILQNSKGLANDLDSIPPFYKWGAGRVILDNAYRGEEQQRAISNMLLQGSDAPMMSNGGFIREFRDGGGKAKRLAKAVTRYRNAQELSDKIAHERDSLKTVYDTARSKADSLLNSAIKSAALEDFINYSNAADSSDIAYKDYLRGVLKANRADIDLQNATYGVQQAERALGMIKPFGAPLLSGNSSENEKKQGNSLLSGDNDPLNVEACGGKINRYPGGGWLDFLNSLGRYGVSQNPGGVAGRYRIDRNFPLNGYKTVKALEGDPWYQTFTNYVLENGGNDPSLIPYFEELDKGTYRDVPKLLENGKLVQGWKDIYEQRRKDGLGGIYHFTPKKEEFQDYLLGLAQNDIVNGVEEDLNRDFARDLAALNGPTLLADYNNREVNDTYVEEPEVEAAISAYKKNNPGPWTRVDSTSGDTEFVGYPTIGRYAGAAFNALAGLHNIFQEPDVYDFGHVAPTFVDGRLALQRQEYNPIDMQQAINQWQAAQNAGYRAISNSGYGASMPAAQLAAMYQGNQAYGNALTAARSYNNQHRASVIGNNNNVENAEANFYNRINAMNTNIANHNAWQNYRMAVQQDLYNKQAENAKWEAVNRALDASAIDLTNIGRENFSMNQINSNPSNLGYGIDARGIISFLASLLKEKEKQNG